jgi:hypothetical protein
MHRLDKLPTLIANQLRRDVPNRGKRKRLTKAIDRTLRSGNTVPLSQVYSEQLEEARAAGETIPNRSARRGFRSGRSAAPRGTGLGGRIK